MSLIQRQHIIYRIDSYFLVNVSVARGGAMGHLHPPRQYCYALDMMEFLCFIDKSLI